MQRKHNAYVFGINFVSLLNLRSIWFVQRVCFVQQKKKQNESMKLVTPKLMYACENEPYFLKLLLAIMEMEDDSSELTYAVSAKTRHITRQKVKDVKLLN